MRDHDPPANPRHALQRAGLSIPGSSQLLNGQPLSDPADRAVLARLVASAPSPAGAHPPSQLPPLPPTPLPSVGPVLLGAGGPARRNTDGSADAIWIDLGFPIGAVERERVRKAGLSWVGVDELFGARALSSVRDRALLASWLGGGEAPRAAPRR